MVLPGILICGILTIRKEISEMQKDKFIELTDDMMMKLSALVDPKTGNVGIGRMYEGFDYLSIAENEIESEIGRAHV